MHQKKDNVSRRAFLRIAGKVCGIGGGAMLLKMTPACLAESKEWHLNPAFRVKEVTAQEVVIFTNLSNGKKLEHNFKGFKADLLRLLVKESDLSSKVSFLAQKHNLSTENCHNKINTSLQELFAQNLVYAGKRILVKVVPEKKNG